MPEFDWNSEGGNSETRDSEVRDSENKDSENRDSEARENPHWDSRGSEDRDSEAGDSENGQIQGPLNSDTPWAPSGCLERTPTGKRFLHSQRAQRSKKFNLARNFQSRTNFWSRSKFSISTSRIPHKKWGRGGWLARKFHSRSKFSTSLEISKFFDLWALWVLHFYCVWMLKVFFFSGTLLLQTHTHTPTRCPPMLKGSNDTLAFLKRAFSRIWVLGGSGSGGIALWGLVWPVLADCCCETKQSCICAWNRSEEIQKVPVRIC